MTATRVHQDDTLHSLMPLNSVWSISFMMKACSLLNFLDLKQSV